MPGTHEFNQLVGKFVAVVPSDVADLARCPAKGIYVGVTGNLAVVDQDGVSNTFVAVQAGTLLPISPNRVLATGTTAGSILACY